MLLTAAGEQLTVAFNRLTRMQMVDWPPVTAAASTACTTCAPPPFAAATSTPPWCPRPRMRTVEPLRTSGGVTPSNITVTRSPVGKIK
jgi:hypothetical protein